MRRAFALVAFIFALFGMLILTACGEAPSQSTAQATVQATATTPPKAKPTATPILLTPIVDPDQVMFDGILSTTPGYCVLDSHAVDKGKVSIGYTLVGDYPPAEFDEQARTCIFDTMSVAYHAGFPVSSVVVTVSGPLKDQYGNTSQVKWATATLYPATAKKFNWGTLNPDSAWRDYDQAWIRN